MRKIDLYFQPYLPLLLPLVWCTYKARHRCECSEQGETNFENTWLSRFLYCSPPWAPAVVKEFQNYNTGREY